MVSAANRFANTMRDVRRWRRVTASPRSSRTRRRRWSRQFGAVQLGAVGVPINTAYKGEYLRHQIADSGARVLVIDGDVADRAVAIADSIDTLEHVVVLGESAAFAESGATTPGTNWHTWSRRDGGRRRRRPHTAGVAHRPLRLHLHRRHHRAVEGLRDQPQLLRHAGQQIATMWQRGPDDVVWTPLPLFHFNAVSVVLVGTLLVGGRAAIYRKFSVSHFWPEVNRTGATHASTLGSIVTLIANDECAPRPPTRGMPEANTTLRFMSGVPMPPAVAQKCVERFGIRPFDAGYGTTEASLWSWLPPGMVNKPNAAGVVNDEYWDIRIFDDDDNEVPAETPGEIVGRPQASRA